MAERIGEPNLAIHFDTHHMNIEEKGAAEGLHAGAKWATYLHVSESDRGVPGTSSVQWDGVFRTPAEIGFDGDLVGESFVAVPPEIAAALRVRRPVARGCEEVLSQGVPFIRDMARRHGLKV